MSTRNTTTGASSNRDHRPTTTTKSNARDRHVVPATGPRPAAEVEQRRQIVASLYLRGLSAAEISRRVGIPRRTIARDIVVLRQELVQQHAARYEELLAERLGELSQIKHAAWETYAAAAPASLNRSGAINSLIHLVELESRLLGLLPRPQQVESLLQDQDRTLKIVLETVDVDGSRSGPIDIEDAVPADQGSRQAAANQHILDPGVDPAIAALLGPASEDDDDG